jgi:hypothetical protein
MTTYNTGRPGVFIQEVALPQVVTLPDTGTAVGALVGVLGQGPTDVPVLLQSWTDFVNTFGPLNDVYPTTWAAFNFFANGGRSLYIKRIPGTASAASITLDDASVSATPTLTVSAKNPGTWGNYLSVSVDAGSAAGRFNLVVYKTTIVSGRSSTAVAETWRDLTLSAIDPHYAPIVINTGSKLISLVDLGSTSTAPTNIPVASSAAYLSGGTDAGSAPVRSDFADALLTFDAIDNPIIFNLPDAGYIYNPVTGISDQRTLSINIQADAVAYADARNDAFVIIDTPSSLTVPNAQQYVSDVAAAFAASSTGNVAAAYYPWLEIPNTLSAAPGALRHQAPGAAMIGQYLATDASRGVFKTPAGYGNRVAIAVATETQLTNAQLDSLNVGTYPINAIRQIPGVGIVVMGGRTLDADPRNRYINIRRSLNYIEKELKRLSAFAVFENNDSILWGKLRATLGNFLSSYWQQGGLRGTSQSQAFYVTCDASNNSFTDMQNGTVNISIGVALEYPAEYVVIQLGQITASATA